MTLLHLSRTWTTALLLLATVTPVAATRAPSKKDLRALDEAERLIERGAYEAALEKLERADGPGGDLAPRVKLNLAVCSNRLERFEEAEGHARAALELSDGKLDGARLELARALIELGRHGEASRLLRELLGHEPTAAQSRQARRLRSRIRRIWPPPALSPDARWLAFMDAEGTVKLSDLTNPPSPPWLPPNPGADIVGFSFLADRGFVSIALDGEVRRWRLSQPAGEPQTLHAGAEPIDVVAFDIKRRRLAVAGREARTVRLLDLEGSAREVTELRGLVPEAGLLAFSPDGRWLAAAQTRPSRTGAEPEIRGRLGLWDLSRPGAEPHRTAGLASVVICLAFSQDGRWLAVGSAEGLRLWDLDEEGSTPAIFAGGAEAESVSSVAFGPHGKRLAAGWTDGTVRLWDLAAPSSEPLSFAAHLGPVWLLDFSDDGAWLASGGGENTARLIDAGGYGIEPRVLGGHSRPLTTLAFGPDARWLATASIDGVARTWPVASTDPWPPPGFAEKYDWPWLREAAEMTERRQARGGSRGPASTRGNLRPPKKVRCPVPRYPKTARKLRVQGVVILELRIDEAGRVTSVKVLRGLPYGLNEAAIDAMKRCDFRPATLDGKPVAVSYNMTTNFSLP